MPDKSNCVRNTFFGLTKFNCDQISAANQIHLYFQIAHYMLNIIYFIYAFTGRRAPYRLFWLNASNIKFHRIHLYHDDARNHIHKLSYMRLIYYYSICARFTQNYSKLHPLGGGGGGGADIINTNNLCMFAAAIEAFAICFYVRPCVSRRRRVEPSIIIFRALLYRFYFEIDFMRQPHHRISKT